MAQRRAEDSARTEILSLLLRQQRDWNDGSVEQYMDGYVRSDSVRFASGGTVSYGWENMLKRYMKGYPDKETMGTLTFSGIDVALLSAESAMVFGKWALQRKSDAPWGYFTLLLRRTPKGWRIFHDHTSSAAAK